MHTCIFPFGRRAGLLDFESDCLYIGFEDFDNDDLKAASIVIITLPIVLIAAVYWGVVLVDYTVQ